MMWMQMAVDWPAHVAAVTSTCTALFAAACLRTLKHNNRTTQSTLKATLKAYEEGARPVLILMRILEQEAQRFAVYRNTGQGVAMNLSQTHIFTTYSDDNVLAPNQETSVMIPMQVDMSVVELRYESLTGRKLCTISSFYPDGSVFNRYIPDAKALGEDGIAHARGACLAFATAMMRHKLKPRPLYTSDGFRANRMPN